MTTTTLRRRLDFALGRGYPTRRRLARCARLAQALLLQAPPGATPALTATQPSLPLPAPAAAAPSPDCCPTCHGTDLYASRARPGLHRCRHCGTEIEAEA